MIHQKVMLLVFTTIVSTFSTFGWAEETFSGRLRLVLEDALHQNFKKDLAILDPKDLSIYLTFENGKVTDAWAHALTFDKAMHFVSVLNKEILPNRIKLGLEISIEGDHWVKGGPARYEIDVTRTENKLNGSVIGVFTGVQPNDPFPVNSKVTGEILPIDPVFAGFKAFQLGEHPRLLIRKDQVEALREKAKTPFGVALLDKIKSSPDEISQGFLYQITGDKKYADQAYAATLKTMDNRNGGPFALGRFWGYRTANVGAAYDLCYDAWTPEQRNAVELYLDWILYKCAYRLHRVGTVNWTPGSNYTVVIHAGHAMAALALWGEPGYGPLEPLPPRKELARLKPPPPVEIPNGVPICKFEPGKPATEWLYAGPFHQRAAQHEHPYYEYKLPFDCLEEIGGEERARPVEGTKVSFKGETITWQRLNSQPEKKLVAIDPKSDRAIFNVTTLSNNRENTWHYFFTVLEIPSGGYYQFNLPHYEGRCVLNGNPFAHGEYVYLEAGRYPLLVPGGIPDGEYQISFGLQQAQEDQALAYYANSSRIDQYTTNLALYQKQLTTYEADGKACQQWKKLEEIYRHWSVLGLEKGMGDGGFQSEGEGYTLECHHVMHDYALSHLNAYGKSVTGRPDISHFAARYVFDAYASGEKKSTQQSYGGHGGGTISARYFARSIALCPKEWQPALLWHWCRLMNTTYESIVSGEGTLKAFSGGEYDEGFELVQSFIHFPLEIKPTNPGEVMPRYWPASTKGFYAFRNKWDSPDSIIAQAYAKQGGAGWNQAEAGSFLIYGLGHEWATKDNSAFGKTGSRWLDNVVMFPDDALNCWGHGSITYAQGDAKTGSGIVTMNMNDVYKGLRSTKEGKDVKVEYIDAGVSGLRSFGVDLTGKCGAPGLFAVADKIIGGKSKVWVHQIPRGSKLSIDKNTFTLSFSDAIYRGTVVSPANATIREAIGKGISELSKVPNSDRTAIHISGPKGEEGDFLIVITLQRANPPEVKVDGSGLSSTVTIGEQQIKFDGTNLVFKN